jgi:ABC-type sugar transport system permease subunit
MTARRAPDRQSRGDGASRPRARQARQAWLFLTPALVLLAVFTFWPVLSGFPPSPSTRSSLRRPGSACEFEDLLDDRSFTSASGTRC